tara:strand:- start:69 stop:206 length:138 start_codon:yes stop_codon:yes gene_type:complete
MEKRRLKQLLEQLEEVLAELKVEVYSDRNSSSDDGFYDDEEGYQE